MWVSVGVDVCVNPYIWSVFARMCARACVGVVVCMSVYIFLYINRDIPGTGYRIRSIFLLGKVLVADRYL